MDKMIRKYYESYEGEPEIQFIKGSDIGNKTILCIWDGYFDDIMRLFTPTNLGWIGLAYYYHMGIGWEEESPWEVPNLNETLAELQSLDERKLEFRGSSEVLSAVCQLLASAIREQEKVWIAKE